ncbi:MAG TPA: TIGR02996 domain-containing protein [Gemmataceae bacterium]|nr:TIGR02996 domain-containing protein [Gemmataceae bacterium]
MWQPLDFRGANLGRVRGVAISPNRQSQIEVWADNGLFNVWYFRTASVTKDGPAAAEANFNPATGVLTWKGTAYAMHGDCGSGGRIFRIPAVTEHPAGDRLVPDPDADNLHITDAAGTVRQTIPNFRASSEPWALATFFDNLTMLLVADPRGVRLFRYVAERGAERPRWKSAGPNTEQKQLYRAVLDHPDEDTPRLMYADWLDENGDPARAEFIRLQCALSEREHAAPVPPADADLRRMLDLRRQMESRWLAEMPLIYGVHWVGFRRGFPGVRVTSPTTLVRSARKVFAAAPVEAVTVDGLNATGAGSLADSPVLRRIRHLTLDRYYIGREGDGPLRRILHAPGVSGLRSLTVTGSFLDEPGMRVVATGPHLTALEWLNTSYGAVTDASAALLLASPALDRLRGGPFRGNNLGPAMKEKLKARFPFA